jgi:hypothetical protein
LYSFAASELRVIRMLRKFLKSDLKRGLLQASPGAAGTTTRPKSTRSIPTLRAFLRG